MSLVGTFGTFTTARLGIYAAQKGLAVVGNNIANINTTGYTRQVLDQVSLSTGGSDLYRSQFDAKVGTGVLVRSINQIRDPYLDIRFRTEMASVGAMDKKLAGLNDIAAILDEVGKGENKGDGLLYAQLQKLAESLRTLGSSAGSQSNDTLARASAEALATLFNTYADKLSVLHKNTVSGFKQDLQKVNETLINIRDLNDSIRNSELYGDRALELRDERNRLIDELSKYMKIDVTYSEEDIGAGKTVEKLTIRLGNANPDSKVQTDSAILVDGIFATQLQMPESYPTKNEQYDPTKVDPNDPATEIFGFKYLKADKTGTNDPAEAEQITNDNFSLSLDKLLDINGREWIDSRTTQKEIQPTAPGTNAVYQMTIVSGNFAAGDKLTLGSQTFTIGRDISVEDANKAEEMAKFLASKLNGRQNKDYAITANGATLVFTAKKPGAVKDPNNPSKDPTVQQGPEAPKEITEPIITPATRTDPTLSFGVMKPTTAGADASQDGTTPAVAAVYTLTVNSSKNWQEGDTFELGGQKFTVGAAGDITVENANKPEEMAKFLAGKLTNQAYDITANADGNLVFTAKTAGALGSPGAPGAAPEKPGKVTVTQGKRTDPSLTFSAATETIAGMDATLPGATKLEDTDEVSYYVTQRQIDGKWYEITTEVYHTQPVDLDDNDLYGSLQSTRELLTESGEFASEDTIQNVDESAAIKRGIPYYQKSLDLLAQQFAKQYNMLNNGHMIDEKGNYLTKTDKLDDKGNPIYERLPEFKTTYYVDADGKYLGVDQAEALAKDPNAKEMTATLNKNMTANEQKAFDDFLGAKDAGGNLINTAPDGKSYADTKAYLDANGVKHADGGNLFSHQGDTDDDSGITAANISVSAGWSKGSTHIVTTYIKPFGEVNNTTQNENVSHMISMIDKGLDYNPQDLDPDAASTHLFHGSFNDMMDNMCSVLGNDRRSTNIMLNTYYSSAVELDTERDSVSGVDLNDEAMNMIQYQKAYSAACRLMTVIDESLDRLINNTGLAGR